MNEFGIPDGVMDFLKLEEIMKVRKYLKLRRSHEIGRGYAIIDRKLDIVIANPLSHELAVALLGVCHDHISKGGKLSDGDKSFWRDLAIKCLKENGFRYQMTEKFIHSGGYFFSKAKGVLCGIYNPTAVYKLGKHMDEVDEEIFESLDCTKHDHLYG